ncbi:lytic transglycosylase domain-containing protein [Candidatus Skiveiella danica]|uniref:lytic transglycosylase domain-containing protein n=1 Tax=Candidatus Skiveiella danica TaxID=3386177 RepID=UPI0009CF00AE|nr:MAG: Transglycosylase SLT domain protein [Alphaproteobacteria bacterium ADurb.Bin100]
MPKSMNSSPQVGWGVAICLIAAFPAHACWEQAAERYSVSPELLYAIARTESGLDPQAVGLNRNGSRDIGLMQINSAWLPKLTTHGIAERDLFDPCTSIHVGAWILAGNVQRLGYTWEAIGAYNATNPALRRAYAERVYRQVAATRARSQPGQPTIASTRPLPVAVTASTQ